MLPQLVLFVSEYFPKCEGQRILYELNIYGSLITPTSLQNIIGYKRELLGVMRKDNVASSCFYKQRAQTILIVHSARLSWHCCQDTYSVQQTMSLPGHILLSGQMSEMPALASLLLMATLTLQSMGTILRCLATMLFQFLNLKSIYHLLSTFQRSLLIVLHYLQGFVGIVPLLRGKEQRELSLCCLG